MSVYDKYQPVIGLEVHVQLATDSKLFSGETTSFGAGANTQVGAYSAGHPGTLPVLNEKAVEYAIKMGFALHCQINRYSEFARKNYFYPDLPKGYQISQFDKPICGPGYLDIHIKETKKRIAVTRIHLEEDAGKSIHDMDDQYTLVDLNRAGVPLIEIVSEPEISSGEEAYQYVTEIRKIVRYLEICDGNMEEGSLRCDANISVMPKGANVFGQRVEVKNMNSVRNVKRAIVHEIKRQIDLIEQGSTVMQETRSYDADRDLTFPMREKEMAHDYRYFPDPDIPPVHISEEQSERIKASIPAMPEELIQKFMNDYGLSFYDAHIISEEKPLSKYYEDLTQHTDNYKAAANWLIGPVKSYLKEQEINIDQLKIEPVQLADLIKLIDSKKINFSIASQQVFPRLVQGKERNVEKLVNELNVVQETDVETIQNLINAIIARYPDKVKEYRSGRKGILGLFMGEVMKASKGKADPRLTNELLLEKLKS